jgi:hypothetical protein
MWLTETSMLCKDHLLGEHSELHKLVGGIRNHPHGKAIADGQAAKGNVDTRVIEQRHAELVQEMRRRGYDHDSPLSYGEDEYQATADIDPEENRRELAGRCAACRARMEVVQ